MLDTSSIYWNLFVINTSLIPLNLSKFCSWYLFDLSRYISLSLSLSLYIYIYIYICLRSNPVLLKLKYLDLSLLFLNPNHFFSLKTFSHSRFQPNPSLNPLVSVLNLFHLSFFMHFMHLDLGFQVFGKNLGGFVLLSKILGWVLLIWSHMLMHCIL